MVTVRPASARETTSVEVFAESSVDDLSPSGASYVSPGARASRTLLEGVRPVGGYLFHEHPAGRQVEGPDPELICAFAVDRHVGARLPVTVVELFGRRFGDRSRLSAGLSRRPVEVDRVAVRRADPLSGRARRDVLLELDVLQFGRVVGGADDVEARGAGAATRATDRDVGRLPVGNRDAFAMVRLAVVCRFAVVLEGSGADLVAAGGDDEKGVRRPAGRIGGGMAAFESEDVVATSPAVERACRRRRDICGGAAGTLDAAESEGDAVDVAPECGLRADREAAGLIGLVGRRGRGVGTRGSDKHRSEDEAYRRGDARIRRVYLQRGGRRVPEATRRTPPLSTSAGTSVLPPHPSPVTEVGQRCAYEE